MQKKKEKKLNPPLAGYNILSAEILKASQKIKRDLKFGNAQNKSKKKSKSE